MAEYYLVLKTMVRIMRTMKEVESINMDIFILHYKNDDDRDNILDADDDNNAMVMTIYILHFTFTFSRPFQTGVIR